MKKIIFLLLFLTLSLWAKENNETQSKDKLNVFTLTQKYILIVYRLNELLDNNTSIFLKEKEDLKAQQNTILAQFPSVISSQNMDQNLVEQFLNEKQGLEARLEKTRHKQDFAFIEAYYDFAKIDLAANFYETLFKLENLFKEAATSKQIINTTQNGLDKIKNYSQMNFETILSNLSDKELKESEILKKELELKSMSYTQILSYILDNANLLESNFIFSEFKLQLLIDKINKIVPNYQYMNSGKISIALVIMVFFYLIKLLLPRFFFFVLMKFSYKKIDNISKKELKTIFIEKTHKPFALLLFFYSLSVCASIFYYPAPVNLTLINFFYIIYAALFAWLIISILDSYGFIIISKLAQKSGKKEIANLIIKILYFIIIIIATLFILAKLGFNVSAIIASLGIGGLAVALAAKDMIANFFASIIVSFDDSFNQGDLVSVAGVEGTIVETGLRKTTIRTFDNSLVYIPNSSIIGANITNWSKRKVGRHIKMILGVSYDAKPEQLEQCVQDLRAYLLQSDLVAGADDNALNDADFKAHYRQNLVSINDLEGYKNACYVSLSEFADSSINIELYFYTKSISAGEFREARQILMLDFMRILEKNGLGFAFPSLSIYVENLKDFPKQA